MLIKEYYSKEHLALRMAMLSSIYAVAPILSTILGGLIDEMFGWRTIFWILSFTYLMGIGIIINKIDNNINLANITISRTLPEYANILKIRKFWQYTIINSLCMAAFFIFISSAPAFLESIDGANSITTGIIMSLPPMGFVLSSIFSEQILKYHSWDKKIFIGRVMALAGGGISASLVYMGLSEILSIMLFALFIGLGNGISTPNIKSAIVSIQTTMLGTTIGLFTFFSSVVGALSSLACGLLVLDYNNITMLYSAIIIPICLSLMSSFFMLFGKLSR